MSNIWRVARAASIRAWMSLERSDAQVSCKGHKIACRRPRLDLQSITCRGALARVTTLQPKFNPIDCQFSNSAIRLEIEYVFGRSWSLTLQTTVIVRNLRIDPRSNVMLFFCEEGKALLTGADIHEVLRSPSTKSSLPTEGADVATLERRSRLHQCIHQEKATTVEAVRWWWWCTGGRGGSVGGGACGEGMAGGNGGGDGGPGGGTEGGADGGRWVAQTYSSHAM